MAMQRYVGKLRCLLLFFFFFAASTSAYPSKYFWGIQFAEISNVSVATSVVVPSTPYYALVYVTNEKGEIEKSLTREFISLGESPTFHLEFQAGIKAGSLNYSWHDAFSEGADQWVVPFTSGEASIVQATVSGSRIGGFGLHIETTDVVFSVNPYYKRLGPGQYKNYLGTSSNTPPPTLSSTTLSPHVVPGISPMYFAVLDPSSYTVVQSANEFLSASYLTLDIPEARNGPDACLAAGGPPSPNGVQMVVGLRDRLLLNTRVGLIQGIIDSNGNFSWVIALQACVAAVDFSEQYSSFHPSFNDLQFAFVEYPRPAFYFSPEADSPFYVLDGWNPGTDATAKPLSASLNIVDASNYFVLVDGGQAASGGVRYYLRVYNMNSSEWSTRFRFPALVNLEPSPTQQTQTLDPNIPPLPGATVPLTLSTILCSRKVSRELFVYGNALLYSASDGVAFYLIRAFATTKIIVVTSASDGSYAFLTADHQVWFGVLGTAMTVQLAPARPRPPAGLVSRAVFFDVHSELWELAYSSAGGFVRSSAIRKDIQQLLEFDSLLTQRTCPVESIVMDAPPNTDVTRDLSTITSLPVRMFLDKGDVYSFSIELTVPFLSTSSEQLPVSVKLERNDFIAVSISRVMGAQVSIYTVHVQDKMTLHQQKAPAVDLFITPLTVMLNNASFSCVDQSKSTSVKSAVQYSTLVYSGCPPGRHIEFDRVGSNSGDGCTEKSGVPCFLHSFDLQPLFNLVDDVSGQVETYGGHYFLNVVAWGRSADDLHYLTPSEYALFNYGTAAIMLALNDLGTPPAYNNNTNDVGWACLSGSPCEKVIPQFPDPPEMYFMLRFSTANAEMNSYCDYVLDFPLRVEGIPMDFSTTYTITVVTLGSLSLAVIIAALVYRWVDPYFFVGDHFD